jgi:hypothetical protein
MILSVNGVRSTKNWYFGPKLLKPLRMLVAGPIKPQSFAAGKLRIDKILSQNVKVFILGGSSHLVSGS